MQFASTRTCLSRADLPAAERDHALFELGQDSLKAGLLDRAEEGPSGHCRRVNMHWVPSGALLTIYEIEKDLDEVDRDRRAY